MPYSGMLRRVPVVTTDVSEEHRSMRQFLVNADVPISQIHVT
jgi:hypothetical protein